MILFLDLETTGLDPGLDRVVEVAAFVTDDSFNQTSTNFQRVVSLDPQCAPISPYVVAMHTKSGLWLEAIAPGAPSIQEVDEELASFIHRENASGAQLAGNSIHFDRSFMTVHLPKSLKMLHYRQIDITSWNEMARRVWPEVHATRPGANTQAVHRALEDAQHSLTTAKYYANRLGVLP